MPKIGMRMIKTAVAVFICFVITWLLSFVRASENTAFFSAIVAIFCIQGDVDTSLKVGVDRFIGTFIGAGAGLGCLLLSQWLDLPRWPILWYAFITVFTVLSIYICLLVRRPGASYIATMLLLTVALLHGTNVEPFQLTWLRLSDTIIGIVVALAVNGFHWPYKKNRDILFLSAAEGVLFHSDGSLATADMIAVNGLLDEGMQLVLATKHSPVLLRPDLNRLKLRLPMIVLNGAALYDPVQNIYYDYEYLDAALCRQLQQVMLDDEMLLFQYVMLHGQLHVYCAGEATPGALPFIERLRHNNEHNFCEGVAEAEHTILLYCTAPEATATRLYGRLRPFEQQGQCTVRQQHNSAIEGYDEVFVYVGAKPIEQLVAQLAAQHGAKEVVALDYRTPSPLYPGADETILVNGARQTAPLTGFDRVIDPSQAEKTLAQIFHARRRKEKPGQTAPG